MKIVGFLQNAWSPFYAGRTWPRESWLRALHTSRSGQRLAIIERVVGEIEWHNTTPIVGATPDSILPADHDHVMGILGRGADVYVLCGRQAGRIVCGSVPTLLLPHPAHRLVTNQLFSFAGHLLKSGFDGAIRLEQKNGSVKAVRIV